MSHCQTYLSVKLQDVYFYEYKFTCSNSYEQYEMISLPFNNEDTLLEVHITYKSQSSEEEKLRQNDDKCCS